MKPGFIYVLNKKEKLKPKDLCVTKNTQKILNFVTEVFALKFEEKPNYSRLKQLLIKELLEFDLIPCEDIYGKKYKSEERLIETRYKDKNYLNE